MIRIERLGAADIARMREMLELFGEVFGEEATYGAAQPDDAYLRRLLKQSSFIALAASAEDRIVGGLAAYELVKFEQARSEIYIYDLAVAESWRRQRVATALIDEVRSIARDAGAWMIFVQADPTDAPAVALYRKLGSEEQVLHYDIEPARLS